MVRQATIRPIMHYTSKTFTEIAKTQLLLETTKTINEDTWKIAGKAPFEWLRSFDIRQICCIKGRKLEWNQRFSRTNQEIIVQMAREEWVIGRRRIERSIKIWIDHIENEVTSQLNQRWNMLGAPITEEGEQKLVVDAQLTKLPNECKARIIIITIIQSVFRNRNIVKTNYRLSAGFKSEVKCSNSKIQSFFLLLSRRWYFITNLSFTKYS